jgi:hypothetical protein
MKKILLKTAEKLGYYVISRRRMYSDIKDSEFWEIYNLCKPYTMTSVERMYALFCSINYILKNKIPGSFVECGVWRGGSSMLIAKMFANRNIVDRKIYLFDTFEGMPNPTDYDSDYSGKSASSLLKKNRSNKQESVWCLADLSDVQNNMRLTNFPEEKIIYIKGKVEITVPTSVLNENIALLRLDTDWYESTKHELIHLFPKLEDNGILIIDDYGHWEGCRKAVDEYFLENEINILLNRIDYTGRIGVKSFANKSFRQG